MASALVRAWLLALGLASCGGDFSQRKTQALATRIIWRNAYGFTRPVPPIEWVHADRLWTGYNGLTLAGWKIEVTCGARCDQPIELGSFAHELFHWACWLWTGDVDIPHRHCDWSRVRAAVDRLQHCLYVIAGGGACSE